MHPEAAALMDMFKGKSMTPCYDLPLKEARVRGDEGDAMMAGTYEEYKGMREELVIPSTDVKGWLDYCRSVTKRDYRL